MVLFGICGELGSGKTLSLTYLTFRNWFYRKMKVFSNYHLFGIPYYYIEYVSQFNYMKDGVACMDELWRVCDARMSRTTKNQFTADILARSRKRHLTYLFTAQVLDTVDGRIRKVQDFTAIPVLNRLETVCRLAIFRTGYPKAKNLMKTVYFYTQDHPIYIGEYGARILNFMRMYDTDEEVDMEDDSKNPVAKPPRLIFQPNYNPAHGYECDCEECGTKYFERWEDADKYAEEYWKKKIDEYLKSLSKEQ